MKSLNPTSINSLRVMSDLQEDGVHILPSVLRIGQPNSHIDNFHEGGMVYGIRNDGFLKEKGYTKYGDVYTKTNSNVVFKMVKSIHTRVPYFKIVSWDIGFNKNEDPIFIEVNTYNQSTELHQIVKIRYLKNLLTTL